MAKVKLHHVLLHAHSPPRWWKSPNRFTIWQNAVRHPVSCHNVRHSVRTTSNCRILKGSDRRVEHKCVSKRSGREKKGNNLAKINVWHKFHFIYFIFFCFFVIHAILKFSLPLSLSLSHSLAAVIVRCAAGGRDHTPCCQRRGVPTACMSICRGVMPHYANGAGSNAAALSGSSYSGSNGTTSSDCLSYAGNILQCIEEGEWNIECLFSCWIAGCLALSGADGGRLSPWLGAIVNIYCWLCLHFFGIFFIII